MSKNKDKKGESLEQMAAQFEQQRRELLDAQFTIRKIQERLDATIVLNEQLALQYQQLQAIYTEKEEEFSIKNETNERRLVTMRNDLTNSEVQNRRLNAALATAEKLLNEERQERAKEMEETQKNFKFQRSKFQTMLSDYKLYMGQRDEREAEIKQLIEAREMGVAYRIKEVADKERERIQATDKIKEEMNTKIRDMQKDLRSLKKEELDTTTRLTMLQNHQLTVELQYQTKQTETIILKSEQLEIKNQQLQQQLSIHCQLEDQLAKRSHFAKGIIKKLNLKVTQLEEELKTRGTSSSALPVHPPQDKNVVFALEKQLQASEKKYAELMARYDQCRTAKEDALVKIENSNKIRNDLAGLLYRSYSDMLDSGSIEFKENQDVLRIDLHRLRSLQVSKWNQEEVKVVMQVLLNSLKPHLNKTNIMIPSLRRNLLISDQNLPSVDGVATERKGEIGDPLATKIASKILGSKLRSWGRTVIHGESELRRKYKFSTSYRE